MSNFRETLLYIKKRAEMLAGLVLSLRSENEHLKAENNELKASLENCQNTIKELENKNINLQLTESLKEGTVENAELKRRLDEMIQEIDDCIAHLKGKAE